ncbi:hypothetical protein [uncultured Brachyspira sp.]|uniref:hypothetical protein n=1 Tax=uncultured Brachyspira sp. TaxID=221953 RepID=UPI0025EE6F53|nr:hypothetical protein [uncultured Brachyspira sp.]
MAVNQRIYSFNENKDLNKMKQKRGNEIMNNEEHDLLITTAQKIGINKDGIRTGNGLITEVSELKDKVNKNNINIKILNDKSDSIKSDADVMKADIKEIRDLLKQGGQNTSKTPFYMDKVRITVIIAVILEGLALIVNFFKDM